MRSRAVAYHIKKDNLNREILLFPLRRFNEQSDGDAAIARLQFEVLELENNYDDLND